MLQVNVRLGEGGASRIARTLHNELSNFGYESTFAYGYGPKGQASPAELTTTSVKRLTSRTRAVTNRATHGAIGKEFLTARPFALSGPSITEVAKEADVVHLHVVHSYMGDYKKLLGDLCSVGKPIVWTMHDQWLLTGRCAIPGNCRLWKAGCGKCPDLAAYPPTKFDLSGSEHALRRRWIHQVAETVPLRIVACAEWLETEARTAGLPNVSHIANSIDPDLWDSLKSKFSERSGSVVRDPATQILFACSDLRDTRKIDWDLLSVVAQTPGLELSIMGDHSPVEIPGARRIPAAKGRDEMASALLSHEVLMFTSKVDTQPLTVIEGLTAGMSVVAAESPATAELANGSAKMSIYSTRQQALELLLRHDSGRRALLPHYSPESMVQAYADQYNELIAQQ